MKVLLDTCVISELQRPKGHPGVRKAVLSFSDDDLFLSVMTLGEITKGVALLPPGKKRSALQGWLNQLEADFADRILPIDSEIARIWGEITARTRRQGSHLPAVDGLIAATAIRHGLHVMTRNTPDYEATGALLINPWEVA